MSTKPQPPTKLKTFKKPSAPLFLFAGEYRMKHELRRVEHKEILQKYQNLNEDKKMKYQRMYEQEMKIYEEKLKEYKQTKEYRLYRRSLKQVKLNYNEKIIILFDSGKTRKP